MQESLYDTVQKLKASQKVNVEELEDLLESKNIKYAVMTCSQSEGCEDETIEVLNNYNVKYYMTKNGAISVLSNEKNIIIKQ